MIVLDTDVLSALMRTEPVSTVTAWLDRQPRLSIWITSVTVLEVRLGLQLLAAGKRRSFLADAFETILKQKISDRVAVFDTAAAQSTADLMAERQRRGRPRELRDSMIAGIVLSRHATLATRNKAHFNDLELAVVNPWDYSLSR